MILSKTSEYAIRILSYMASSEGELYSAKSILEKISIPQKYMRRIMTDLSKHGFIQSVQGRDGGYKFLKNPSQIYISDIIDALDGMEKFVGCILGFEECSCKNPCALHESYLETKEKLHKTFSETNLLTIKNSSFLRF